MTYPDARTAVGALASRSATLADLREIVTSFPELRPVVAAYPDADEDLLGWLRDLHDPLVDAQLARRSAHPPAPSAPHVEAPPQRASIAVGRPAVPPPAPTVEVPGAAPGGPVTPVFTPDPESSRSKRRVWPVLATVVGALLLVGGGLGAAFATGLISAPTTPAKVAPTPKATVEKSTQPTSEAPSRPGASDEPSETSPASPLPTQPSTPNPALTCWDGTPAASLSACGVPEGVAGLRYVFPSLDDNLKSSAYACKMVNYPKRDAYTFSYDCRLPDETPQTSPQIVRYRFWTDEKAAMKHYKGIFADTGSSADLVLEGQHVGTVFHSNGPLPAGLGRYAIAFVVLDGHMCLSIEGSSKALLNDMVKEARFRVPDEFLGYSGERPTEVSWHE